MAKAKLPDVLKKRELLADHGLSEAEMAAIGEGFLEQGGYCDAIEFFQKAGAEDRLMAVLDLMVEQGDYFLAEKIERFLGEPLGDEVWRGLMKNAENLGKNNFASLARARIEEA